MHVVDPVSADRLEHGSALMGGLVDGTVEQSPGAADMPVVAHGFLVAPPIEKTWYWWWDWCWHN